MFYQILQIVVLLIAGVLGFQVHGLWHSSEDTEAMLTEEF